MRGLTKVAILLLLPGCGSIAYGDNEPEQAREQVVVTSGGPAYAYAYAQPQPLPPPRFVQPAPAPLPPVVMVMPSAPVQQFQQPQFQQPQFQQPRFQQPRFQQPARGLIVCSGNQRVRISDQRLDGGNGPAVHASGNCVVDIDESIVRGVPAIVATGNAQLRFSECRIQGEILTAGNAQIETPGSRLERGPRRRL
jgi:hypothetical protein